MMYRKLPVDVQGGLAVTLLRIELGHCARDEWGVLGPRGLAPGNFLLLCGLGQSYLQLSHVRLSGLILALAVRLRRSIGKRSKRFRGHKYAVSLSLVVRFRG